MQARLFLSEEIVISFLQENAKKEITVCRGRQKWRRRYGTEEIRLMQKREIENSFRLPTLFWVTYFCGRVGS